MKTLKFIAIIALAAMSFRAGAQDGLMSCRNRLYREARAEGASWMSRYSLAYFDILILFNNPDERTVPALLEESEKIIAALSEEKEADRSEVEALKGLRYLALMKINPQQNGPRYSGALCEACAKSSALNPDNPRAIIVNAIYKKYMSAFMHQEYDPSEDFARAEKLLDRQENSSDAPSWGREFIGQ